MLGGVAAGLGNYFKVDPTIVRAAFVILTLITGGAFLILYVAMWLLVPTAGSTATEPGQIVQENLNDMGARVRGFAGAPTTPTNGAPNGGSVPNGGNGGNGGNGSIVPAQTGANHRHGIGPYILIGFGLLFLLGNFGFFHMFAWRAFWPLLLIALGVMILSRRNR
jgi:phage shock protein PspC (stress-responsive transcriptional regulator)